MELYVGLSSGFILVLDPMTFAPLCSLSCHRSQVSSLLSLDLSTFQPDSTPNTRDMPSGTSHGSNHPSFGFSADSPSPINTPHMSVSRYGPHVHVPTCMYMIIC